MGVHRRQVLWPGWDPGGEHVFHGNWSIRRAALCVASSAGVRRRRSGGAVFHRSTVCCDYGTGVVVLIVLFAATFGGVYIFPVCDWELCRRSAWLCKNDPR